MDSADRPLPLSLTLVPSRWKTLGLIAGSFAFVAIGVWMISKGHLLGWLPAVFFGSCFVIGIVNLIPGCSSLKLTEDGFEVRSMFRSWSVSWRTISEIGVYSLYQNGAEIARMVGFNQTDEWRSQSRMKALSKSLSGFERGIPDTYGLSAEALAELLARYWEAWRAKNLDEISEQFTIPADDGE